jgi:hypothetical protein
VRLRLRWQEDQPQAALPTSAWWPGSATFVCERSFARTCRLTHGRGSRAAASRETRQKSRQGDPAGSGRRHQGGRLGLRNYVKADGELGDFQHKFRVYDREGARCPTPRCKGKIRRIVQTGRSTFYCPVCQH